VNPLYRSLFKPILDKASRSAYRMRGSAGEFTKAADAVGERIYKSPYYKAYMDAARGKGGKVKQIAALGTPIYAYNKLSDLTSMPFRATEPEKEEEVTTESKPPKKDDNLLVTEKDKKETVDENTEVNEETLTNDSNVSDGSSNNQSLVEQSNIYAGLIDNDSLRRIEGYKDVIRQFIGSGDEGEQMQKTGLLLQLGSALMAGKSTDPGLKGFMEIVGQAGMQVAPTLFQMGVEKGKSEREIGAAALNLYMDQLDKASDRSGPLTVAYENVYKTDGNNNLVYDANGDPIPIDRQRVGTYYRMSPEMMNFMDMNAQLGYERFTFVDTTASKEGIEASGLGGGFETTMQSKAARDNQKKYAKYVRRGLNTMADYIMPLIIEQRDTLTGFWGEVGRLVGPKKALLDSFNQALFNSAGGEKEFNAKFDTIQKDTLADMEASNYIVYEGANATQVIGGVEVGFFIDKNNKYGFNDGARYSDDGKTLLDPGEAAWIPTRSGIEMLLDNPNRLATKTFETTLGLMLARDRQPTGRMLADVLRRSFEETKMTGLGGDLSTSPVQVINNYVRIYGQLYKNMSNAFRAAGVTDDEEVGNQPGWTYDPISFKIDGLDKFVSSYYQLRYNDERYVEDIEGAPLYGAWVQSIGGNIQMDNNENMGSTVDIHKNIMDQLN
jgi:hypothetical protein